MSIVSLYRIFFFFLFFSSSSILVHAASLDILSWNLGNFFDEKDDGREYPCYQIASGFWNRKRVLEKTRRITQFIKELKELPDVLAFQELENQRLLSWISQSLAPLGYRYGAFAEGQQALSVAFLSRWSLGELRTYKKGSFSSGGRPLLRVLLEKEGIRWALLNNHWKSYAGSSRQESLLKRQDDKESFLHAWQESQDYAPWRVALGDFNRAKTDTFIKQDGDELTLEGLKDRLWIPYQIAGKGSFYYKGQWHALDQVWLDLSWKDSALTKVVSYYVDAPQLVNDQGRPSAYDCYRRPREGVSDHLPLWISLERES